jgi:phospholipid transport system substrate-binding protein
MHRLSARLPRLALLVIAAVLATTPLSLRSGRAEPATAAADATVRELADGAWTLLHRADLDQRQRLDQLVALLESKTDVGLLSRLVLGRNWQRLSEQQQARYEGLFGQVVMRNLARRLDQFVNGADGTLADHLQFLSSQQVGQADVLVRTKVRTPQGDVLDVDWRLRARDDRPLIIDLIIEGASLLVAQRSEFATVIERSDVDGLLAELSARAGSTDS